MTGTDGPSLQERYAPGSICFGCGPANVGGLHVRSHRRVDGSLVATWTPGPEHAAFPGVLSGGVIGTLLDCHSNWTAAIHLMERDGLAVPPVTVTAGFDVRLRRPTPLGAPLTLTARIVESEGDRAVVESRLTAAGETTASARATFVAVGPGHPAYEAWRAPATSSSASETASGT